VRGRSVRERRVRGRRVRGRRVRGRRVHHANMLQFKSLVHNTVGVKYKLCC